LPWNITPAEPLDGLACPMGLADAWLAGLIPVPVDGDVEPELEQAPSASEMISAAPAALRSVFRTVKRFMDVVTPLRKSARSDCGMAGAGPEIRASGAAAAWAEITVTLDQYDCQFQRDYNK
jgi:hypothetical protein